MLPPGNSVPPALSNKQHRTLSARFSAVIPMGSPACESVSPAHRLSSIFRPLPRATPHLWFARQEAHVSEQYAIVKTAFYWYVATSVVEVVGS